MLLTVGTAVLALSLTMKGNNLEGLVPPVPVKTFETHEGKEVAWRGIPARKLLDVAFDKNWEKAEEILFTCEDGYQPSIPVAKFKQYDAYFAVARADQEAFTMVNKLRNGETVQLGPYYLVWDNIKAADLKIEGASDQPYQIVKMELISFAARFPQMAPPKGSSAAVQRGFLNFRKHCQSCHTVNGEGGGKGIELNFPVSVTEYIRDDFFKKWLKDPPAMRWNASMPALNPALPKRDAVVDDILAYLKAMAKRKLEPKKT